MSFRAKKGGFLSAFLFLRKYACLNTQILQLLLFHYNPFIRVPILVSKVLILRLNLVRYTVVFCYFR